MVYDSKSSAYGTVAVKVASWPLPCLPPRWGDGNSVKTISQGSYTAVLPCAQLNLVSFALPLRGSCQGAEGVVASWWGAGGMGGDSKGWCPSPPGRGDSRAGSSRSLSRSSRPSPPGRGDSRKKALPSLWPER